MPIPITCFDDFYHDPDKVREWALTLDYYPPQKNENFPGMRTNSLETLDSNIFDQFCEKLFSLFYDPFSSQVEWVCHTSFQKIYSYDNNPENLLNSGWTHADEKCVFAGIIYLNPNPDPNSGTMILNPNQKFIFNNELDFSYRNKMFHDEDVDYDECLKHMIEHEKKFDVSIEVKNKYNRLLCYSNDVWHKQSGFIMNDDFRLTQVFFVSELKSNTFPNLRVKNINQL